MRYALDPYTKMTAKESRAVADLLIALRRLPRGLTLEIVDEGAVVRKQTPSYSANVALLARKSLYGGV